jgi:hypothetical protein
MKVQQIKDGERIITLYNVVGEIKDYIKTINEKLDKQNEKPDSFKDAAFRLFEKIVEYAILGGLFYWIANLSK